MTPAPLAVPVAAEVIRSVSVSHLLIVLAPLFGAILAGLFQETLGRRGAHRVTIAAVALSFLLSLTVFWSVVVAGGPVVDATVYTWARIPGLTMEIGFLIDPLSATMMLVVTFVSLMVHIYTIGYMAEDPGYQRFFAYISLFTFSMLMLVMANNLLQLFFGWEAVGLVSYLLIGFWFRRPSAIHANLKAFLVNRVGDFGFLLGIAGVLMYTGSLHYAEIFARAGELTAIEVAPFGAPVTVATLVCICLFIGAMGKSAQVPLHVWLPDSMEGPTPISALIHAATMVTAGIFMVARLSPLFELSETALSFILVIGATTTLFMGLLGVVQHDIKRVVAYSTLSQLGYMTVALGASAYGAAIFHLVTHAFFKALLFLAAGSVIIGLHHEQDMRRMGGLWRIMPITWATAVIGTLALVGFPGFAGFYSKDAIIEAVRASELWGSGYASFAVLASVFVTSLYSFRLLFLVFHGRSRVDHHTLEHAHESPAVVTWPLVLLAVPSVLAGAVLAEPMLFGSYFGTALHVAEGRAPLHELAHHWHGWFSFLLHGFTAPPFWLMLGGAVVAWLLFIAIPSLPARIAGGLRPVDVLLNEKYGFDRFNEGVLARGTHAMGTGLWGVGDVFLIDGMLVNGSARLVRAVAAVVRHVQSGFLYHYAFAMIVGLLLLLISFGRVAMPF
jgi:NADH-quinone oxidoreductase subunit L